MFFHYVHTHTHTYMLLLFKKKINKNKIQNDSRFFPPPSSPLSTHLTPALNLCYYLYLRLRLVSSLRINVVAYNIKRHNHFMLPSHSVHSWYYYIFLNKNTFRMSCCYYYIFLFYFVIFVDNENQCTNIYMQTQRANQRCKKL